MTWRRIVAVVLIVSLGAGLGVALRIYANRQPNPYHPYLPASRDNAYQALAAIKRTNGVVGCDPTVGEEFAPRASLPPATGFPLPSKEVGRCFTYPDRWLNVSLWGDDTMYVYAVDAQSVGPISTDQKELLVKVASLAAGGLPEKVVKKLGGSDGEGDEGREEGETFTSDGAEATISRSDDKGWQVSVTARDAESLARFLSEHKPIDPARLARNFAPKFHFTHTEDFKPLSIDALRGRADLCEKNLKTQEVDRSTCTSLKDFPTKNPCGRGKCDREWILDLPPDEYDPKGYVEIENTVRHGLYRRPVVYWHLADLGFRRELSYWVYYLYNNFANIHEGDWESVQVDLVGGKGKDSVGVARWFFSSHGGGDTQSCAAIPSDCRHPDVYVAHGSHANYFTPGKHDAVATCPVGHRCVLSPRPDVTEKSKKPLILDDYQLVELKDPPYVGSYGRENLKARWIRHMKIPGWKRDSPSDPRIRTEWHLAPLAPFENAVGNAPQALSWMVVELED